MIEEVIVTRINVNRKDDQQYFQVVLPRDTVRIKGIETGATLKSNLPATTEKFLGTLQLQAEGQSNYCYCTDIFLDRPAAEITTFGFGQQWLKRALEQSTAKEPERMDVSFCRVLYGCYRDIIGQRLNMNLDYTISIYTWIERIGFGTTNNRQ